LNTTPEFDFWDFPHTKERDMEAEIKRLLESIREKTKRAQDEGPDAEPVTLTPAEATLVYRALFESR
jgi:hypothetical protein